MLRISKRAFANVTPTPEDFPTLLKNIEGKWKTKLARRHERERHAGSKETSPRYILSMFPYPSGRLHLGHVRTYTSADLLARYSRLMLKNQDLEPDFTHVINPMGFDSFGLPAENAARQRGLDPAEWTKSNIRAMKKQLDDLAFNFDWREATSNPSFYKWTQEIFLRLFDQGLVYKSYAQVNWDPVDQTVLADEQVDENGLSWRSGAKVEKVNHRQWFIKANAYVNDIYDAQDIDSSSWGDVLAIQRNWVGQPSGWLFYLPLNTSLSVDRDVLPIFTNNPELFLGEDTKVIVAESHWLNQVYEIGREDLLINPFNGKPLQIETVDNSDELPPNFRSTLRGTTVPSQLSRELVLAQARLLKIGGYFTSDRYRDWLVSRQRFWGTPIPIIKCDSCGLVGVSRDSLPVRLPEVYHLLKVTSRNENLPQTGIKSALDEVAPKEWLHTKCEACGSDAVRDSETFDTLFDSSWYFLRYSTDPKQDMPYDPDQVQPVWCYIGGKEHAAMHLFYARFITHFLHSQGQLKFREPFRRLLVQGIVKGKTYKLKGKYLNQHEADSLGSNDMLEVEYEKMSKSKGNGVDPQDLIDKYGIDATRLCLMSYANPRSERLWRSSFEEFKDIIQLMRRIWLTLQSYLQAAKASEPGSVEKLRPSELGVDLLQAAKEELKKTRDLACKKSIYLIEDVYQFRQFISVIHVLLNSLRKCENTTAIFTEEFAESFATLVVMMNPVAPHFSEELWLHFSRCPSNPLRSNAKSRFKMELQASDQPWPLPDGDVTIEAKQTKKKRRKR